MKKLFILLALACSCSPAVQRLSDSMAGVRDYVPRYAVMAHRGSTYWAPEETESAWRWAREMGADYLESDLQCTKDGVILANHDVNLTRTSDIAAVFGEGLPRSREVFYKSLGFSESDAKEQCARDLETFQPYQASSYYYAELLTLDAGSWFNAARPGQARPAFAGSQYVSALQDQIAYAEGKRLRRDARGRRVLPFKLKESCAGKTLGQLSACAKEGGKYMEIIDYDFSSAYEPDPADTGNRPGIYIEFKEPEVNPEDIEQRVFDILVSLVLIVILAIPMLVIAVWIKADSKGTVFYRQERVTTYGKHFRIHKFRTMVSNADKIGTSVTVDNDVRITRVGAKLRDHRLDEFPQVFDVLAGTMSFVGTRPEVVKYVDRYTDEMNATLLMPAGITSIASIEYKDEAELLEKAEDADEVYVKDILPEKMKYNLKSVKDFGFFKDIGVLFKTVAAVL